MSRPLIRFVQCDRCGKRVEHNQGGSQWVPPNWCEVYYANQDQTRHACETCSPFVTIALTEIK